MLQSGFRTFRRTALVALVSSAMLSGLLIGVTQTPAAATVTSVRGNACSYYVKVGLFGGPQALNGCGEAGRVPSPSPAPGASDSSYSPHVALPGTGNGSATAIVATDNDGAAAVYGPATIHGGIWPDDVLTAPPSGPQFASTQGTTGASGSVTSIAQIRLHDSPTPVVCYDDRFEPDPKPKNCLAPGGFGPPPVWGDSLKAECNATESSVTGKATFENSFYATATDAAGAPLPSATFPIPDNNPTLPGAQPAPNTVRHGVITNVGDVFTVVFNQQIVNPDKSLTVNAVHMYLFGPTAVGEVVRGQVNCGTTPSNAQSTDIIAPSCGTPVVEPISPEEPTPKSPRQELVGVFDAGTGASPSGIVKVDKISVANGTVSLGNPNPDWPQYTKFTVGQTGPLPMTATRTAEAEAANLPLAWSFSVTDAAGNVSRCNGIIAGPTPEPPILAVNDIVVNEGNVGTTAATFTVTRYGDTSGTTGVTAKTTAATAAAGDDFTAHTGTPLTFAATETSKTVTVNVSGDTEPEKDETFTLTLSGATAGTVMGDAAGKATIRNDDGAAFLEVRSVVVPEGGTASFTVLRTGNTTGTSTVTAKVAGGNASAGPDYTAVTDQGLTFTPGQTSKTVSVNTINDAIAEPNETFNLTLSGQSVGTTLGDAAGTAYIDDDDGTTAAPKSTFFAVNSLAQDEGSATFTVTRYGDTGAATISYKTGGGSAAAGTDYTAVTSGTVSFAAGDTSSKSVTIDVVADTVPEKDETISLVLFGPPSNAVLGDSSGTATLLNDDGFSYLAVTNRWKNEGSSGPNSFDVTVNRYGNTTSPATVKAKTGGGTATAGTDYTAITEVVVDFAAGESTKAVTVTVDGDASVEPNQTFNVTLFAQGVGVVLADAAGTATIVNDD